MAGQNVVMLEKDSGFLVFIPKKLLKNPEDLPSSLRHLDLDPEQLKPVTLDDIYAEGKDQKSPKIERWEDLWSQNCQLKKRWFFVGLDNPTLTK